MPKAALQLLRFPVIDATGVMGELTQPDSLRPAVSISLGAIGLTDPNNSNLPVIFGEILLGLGSVIQLNHQISLASSASTTPSVQTGSLSISGKIVDVQGTLDVPGGSISVTGASSFPVKDTTSPSAAKLTLTIGPNAVISAAGEMLQIVDPLGFGRQLGSVLPGGSVSLAGNIDLAPGSLIDVSGSTGRVFIPAAGLTQSVQEARPELLQGLNFSSTTQVDSSGGSITLAGGEELIALGTLLGKAGGPTATGGTLIKGK